MIKFFLTKNPYQTKKLGEILAKEVLKTPLKKKALVLGLEGDLGGGKTTFLQGFAKGLGIKERILSPTFIIMRRFQLFNLNFKTFYHYDCYRIKNTKEILSLGFKKNILNSQNIITIEWADKIKKTLPREALILNFFFVDKKTRKITLQFKNG